MNVGPWKKAIFHGPWCKLTVTWSVIEKVTIVTLNIIFNVGNTLNTDPWTMYLHWDIFHCIKILEWEGNLGEGFMVRIGTNPLQLRRDYVCKDFSVNLLFYFIKGSKFGLRRRIWWFPTQDVAKEWAGTWFEMISIRLRVERIICGSDSVVVDVRGTTDKVFTLYIMWHKLGTLNVSIDL